MDSYSDWVNTTVAMRFAFQHNMVSKLCWATVSDRWWSHFIYSTGTNTNNSVCMCFETSGLATPTVHIDTTENIVVSCVSLEEVITASYMRIFLGTVFNYIG